MSSKKKKNQKPVHVGLSITQSAVEVAVFNPKTFAIEQSSSYPVPDGLLDEDGDRVLDEGLLQEVIEEVMASIRPKPKMVHLSLPGTLLRMVEMPKMGESELYVSLSSEAERYKTFDHTDAIVDFADVDAPSHSLQQGQQLIAFGAVRSDTLEVYRRVLVKKLKIKLASVSLEPLNVLRAMAGTGVLDSLIAQIGMDTHWGTIFVEPTRIRISLWQANQLLELRETQMDTRELMTATGDSMIVEDIVEEIRRTTKMAQPAIWLTHNMPYTMEEILNGRLGVPFRSAMLGDSLSLSDPNMQIATVGCALKSIVSYPFDFDIMSGMGRGLGGGEVDEGEQMNIDWLIPAGASVLVLSLIATGVIAAISTFSSQEIPKLQTSKDEITTQLAQMQAEEAALKEKVDLDVRLLDLIRSAAVRNHVYVELTEDVKQRIPVDSWIHAMTVTSGNQLDIQGVTRNHADAIDFARSFDSVKYLQGVTIGAIKETMIGRTPVFDFSITGNVNPDPTLLNQFIEAHQGGGKAPKLDGLAEPGGV